MPPRVKAFHYLTVLRLLRMRAVHPDHSESGSALAASREACLAHLSALLRAQLIIWLGLAPLASEPQNHAMTV